jgi:hypothetical protein
LDVFTIRDRWIHKFNIPDAAGARLFWAAFVILLVTQFSQGTMFILDYPSESFPYHLFMVAGVIAAIKVLAFNDFKDWKELLLAITIGLLILAGCQLSNDWNFIYYYLVVLASQKVKFEKIVRIFLIVVTLGILITIIAASFGVIMELTNSRTGDPRVRYALGMVYPTDLAARAFYLQLFYVVYRKFKLSLPELIIGAAFTFIIYAFTDTRLDVILMTLTLIIAVVYEKTINLIKIIGNKYLSLIGVVSILGIIVLTYLYRASNPLFKILNKLLSGRMEFGHQAFVKYNVTFFGQFVLQNGNGGIHHGAFDYFFIDCSFLRILMMNGFIAFVLILVALYYLSRKFMQGKCYSLEIALLLIVASSLIDQHLIEISFNILFVALFANLSYFKEDTEIQPRKKFSHKTFS